MRWAYCIGISNCNTQFINHSHFISCTQGIHGGILLCPGNSNGIGSSGLGLAGIAVNSKQACKKHERAGFFTNIGSYREWIENEINQVERTTSGCCKISEPNWIVLLVTSIHFSLTNNK